MFFPNPLSKINFTNLEKQYQMTFILSLSIYNILGE